MAKVRIREYRENQGIKRFVRHLGEIELFSVPPIGSKVYLTQDGVEGMYQVVDVVFNDRQQVNIHVLDAGRPDESFPF